MEEHKYTEVAPGIWGMKIIFVNIYMIATGPKEWVLVDAGLKGSAGRIQKMAASLFGEDNPPSAIILT
uniref:MBL fold metallo-hydrolase n=1 Tax=Pedobacter sp. TaxID=1411316 RepID=UPI003D7FEE11